LTVGAISMASTTPCVQGQWTPDHINLEWERQYVRIRELHPHAALIVGLADSPAGPTPLQEACQLIINAVQERNKSHNGSASATSGSNTAVITQLAVLYAGARQYIQTVRRILNGYA